MTRKRKDANQKTIEQHAHKIGGGWIDTTDAPRVGFDGIFLYMGTAFLIEVKDGAKAKSARQLTKNEAKRHAYVSQFGCVIHIIEGIEDLDRLARTVSTIRIASVSA